MAAQNKNDAVAQDTGSVRLREILLSETASWKREVNLNQTGLTSLPPEIGNCAQLRELLLEGNRLTGLPPELGNCAQLRTLDLGRNHLTTLPAEIGRCEHLERLHLQNNKLVALPPEIGLCQQLQILDIRGNPGLGLPQEITASLANPKAILDYYFARQKEGSRPLNEVKLMLVGRGEVGKTSVSRGLRGGKNAFDPNMKETPGIEILPWSVKCGKDKISVSMWDFAGQEITHETHRYFLTHRSLYLVVLDGRANLQMEDADYWLGLVEKYGTDGDGERSPVIVVLNKWASGCYDLETSRLQRLHPNVRAFIKTDCKTGLGLTELRRTIVAVLDTMPSVRQTWAVSYDKVRQELRKRLEKGGNFLNWQAYKKVCEECGVAEDQQESLAQNLHALGIALYYGDNQRLRDTRVINPHWAANGLYGIVRGVKARPRAGHPGELVVGNAAAVLRAGVANMQGVKAADYTAPEILSFLLELMLARELAFAVPGGKIYILPGLLPLDEPHPGQYNMMEHLEKAQVKFRYLYEMLPTGVMPRFIVRTHPLSDHWFRWQRGVVLAWGDARALVMAERRMNPRVDVYVTGRSAAERQALAGVVRSNMDAIHADLPEGLRGKEQLDLTLPGEQFVSVKELEDLEEKDLPIQVEGTGGRLIDVTSQLEQVQPAQRRRAPRLRVFVSYAHANFSLWERLKIHLAILENARLIDHWSDRKIPPGKEWDGKIRQELREADIVVVLLSPAFFASKYIQGGDEGGARPSPTRQSGNIAYSVGGQSCIDGTQVVERPTCCAFGGWKPETHHKTQVARRWLECCGKGAEGNDHCDSGATERRTVTSVPKKNLENREHRDSRSSFTLDSGNSKSWGQKSRVPAVRDFGHASCYVLVTVKLFVPRGAKPTFLSFVNDYLKRFR